MKLVSHLTVIGFVLLCTGIWAQAFDKTEQGILVTVGQTRVELASARPGIFRLSVSFDANPKPAPSIFLAGKEPQVGEGDGATPNSGKAGAPGVVLPATKEAWDAVTIDDKVGVKTSSGELLIDPNSGVWTLLDASGQVLISQGTLAVLQKDNKTNRENVTFDVGMKNNKPLHIYGNGNGTSALMKTDGNSRMENGISVIPYYWCTAGYSAFGVSADDDSPAKWNTKADETSIVTWSFPGRTADLYLTPALNLYQASQKYADLTGHPKISPKWAFGYLQSRWGWKDKAYIDDTLKTFHDHKLPVDAFIFDFECYTKTPDYALKPEGESNFTDFAWNPQLFPEPARQFADYRAQGLRVIPIRKPRIGNSDALKMMHDKGWILVTGKNGEAVANFDARDIDFENPEVRKWYIDQSHQMIDDGVAGWWNDEGESVYTKYYYWNLAEYEARAEFKPGQRHWSINRAWQPGMERLGAAAWTGDIGTDWKTLAVTPANILNWGLAGMPYGSCDIGGFFGSPSPEMLARWMQAGVFLPVMRSHSSNGVDPRFPWLYGKDAEDAIRKALELRYRLVPFYYSLAHETYETGAPFMRPMVMEFPDDPKVQDMTDQWLMGTGLMTAPLLDPGGKRTVYFPDGTWYKFDTGEVQQGGQTIEVTSPLDAIPVYVRAGTILTLGPVVQNTIQLPGGPLEVQVYAGKDADFTLVEDDGISYNYVSGDIRKTAFHWDDSKRTFAWKQEGPYQGEDVFKAIHVVVFDENGKKEASGKLDPTGSATFK
jgi:alpha-glucosidase